VSVTLCLSMPAGMDGRAQRVCTCVRMRPWFALFFGGDVRGLRFFLSFFGGGDDVRGLLIMWCPSAARGQGRDGGGGKSDLKKKDPDLGSDVYKIVKLINAKGLEPCIVFSFSRR
jgi:hypothetical protein